MVVQTIVQGNQKDGKANWWSIDFGPIVDICQLPHVPTEGAPIRGYLWSTTTTNSSCHEVSICWIISVLSLDALCHNHFIVWVLHKQLITMLCYVLVVGQRLSVQRTLLHTCFLHIAIKLPWHGLTKYNTCFYTMFILMVEMHFSSLCFTLIPILVPTFYFYHIYFLFGKTSFILVLSINALMAKSWVIDGTIKIKKKIYFDIKKCHVSI